MTFLSSCLQCLPSFVVVCCLLFVVTSTETRTSVRVQLCFSIHENNKLDS